MVSRFALAAAEGILNLPVMIMVNFLNELLGGKNKLTFSDNERFQFPLLRRSLHDFCLYCMCTDKPENKHRLRLANTMRPILGLRVHLRILTET